MDHEANLQIEDPQPKQLRTAPSEPQRITLRNGAWFYISSQWEKDGEAIIMTRKGNWVLFAANVYLACSRDFAIRWLRSNGFTEEAAFHHDQSLEI